MAKQRNGNASAKFRPKQSQKSNIIVKKQGGRVQDARQRLIQKKRKTIVDARDVLTRKSVVRDARLKINKMRGNQTRDGRTVPVNSNVKVIGSNIVQKTDRNGKISLLTNKSKQKSELTGRLSNLAIQKHLGLVANQRAPMQRAPMRRSIPTTSAKRPMSVAKPLSIRKTILNDVDFYEPSSNPVQMYDSSLYKWSKADMRVHPASRLINSLEVREPERDIIRREPVYEWPTFATHRYRPFRFESSNYVDLDTIQDEEMPLVNPRSSVTLQGTSRVTNVRSRLDSLPQPESHGIFSQAKAKVVVPAGHRIVVSNLQPSVTQDDIKELFEDIGQLLTAKLVRSGVAEVIYKNLQDAQKAVDTYHNRQLDGQPMKCLLVNKRPLNHPTAPAIKSESPLKRKLAVPPCPPGNKLVPDIETIHKVLFQRK